MIFFHWHISWSSHVYAFFVFNWDFTVFFWGKLSQFRRFIYLHGQPSALCREEKVRDASFPKEVSTSNPLKPFDGAPCFGWSWRALFCVLTRVDLPKNRGQNKASRPYVFFFRNKCPTSKPIFKELGGWLRSKQIWFWIEGWNLVHRMGKGSDFGEGWPQGLFELNPEYNPRNVWSGEVRAGSPTTHPWVVGWKNPPFFESINYQLSR